MKKMSLTSTRHIITPAMICFLLSPLLAFLIAVKNLVRRSNGIVFILFYVIYGYAHSFLDTRGDSYRKAINFIKTNPDNSYLEIIKTYLKGEISDVFEPLLLVFVRNFTDNPHVFLAIVGAIGGSFIYLSLRKVWIFWGGKYYFELYIASILIILLLNPIMIGGVRFFVASSIFIYGLTTALLNKQYWAWALIFFTPLIHFSFWISVIFVVLTKFLYIRNSLLWKSLVVVCLSSLFFNAQDWEGVFASYDISETNQVIGNKALSYSAEKTAMRYAASLTVKFMNIQQYLTRLSILITIFFLNKKLPKLQLNRWDTELYRLTLLFLIFGYMLISFSVVGERYLLPGLFLFFVLIGRLTTYKNSNLFGRLLRIIFLLSIFNIGWVIANTYFLIDHRLFYAPLPLLFI